VNLATLLGGDTSDHVGAVLNGLLGVEGTLEFPPQKNRCSVSQWM